VIALGELQISWVGSDEGEILVTDEFDIPAASEDAVENQIEEEENV
jgi:segregation and condensation protein A